MTNNYDISSIDYSSNDDCESYSDDYERLFSPFNAQWSPSDDEDEYDEDEYDEDEYDEDEDMVSTLRTKLTNLECEISDSCHKIQDFIFDLSENNQIKQNIYIEHSNNMKSIFDAYKESIRILSSINNIISLDFEEKKIQLDNANCKNKRLKSMIKELEKSSNIMNKKRKDSNLSLSTIYTNYYLSKNS